MQKHDAAGKESAGGAEPCPSWVKQVPTFTSDQYKIHIGGKDVDVPGSGIIAFNEPDPANSRMRDAFLDAADRMRERMGFRSGSSLLSSLYEITGGRFLKLGVESGDDFWIISGCISSLHN